jgi:hypothetical protein
MQAEKCGGMHSVGPKVLAVLLEVLGATCHSKITGCPSHPHSIAGEL